MAIISPQPPSLTAIRHCLTASVIEVLVCLFIFNLFISSAVPIVGAWRLYGRGPFIMVHDSTDRAVGDVIEQPTSLIGTHAFLHQHVSPMAGTDFELTFIFSGLSAGIACTIAGQMISEGALRWTGRRWVPFLVTRLLTVMLSTVIVGWLLGRILFGRGGVPEAGK